MRRTFQYVVAILVLLGLGSSVVGLIYLRRVYGRNEDVSPVRLDRTLGDTCTQLPTTNDFERFWREFQSAVRSRDKDKLFPMMHTCGFVWWGEQLTLRSVHWIPGRDATLQAVSGALIFEGREDFDKNYDRIFTKVIRAKILNGVPWQEDEGRHAVSWETGRDETYSLRFERLDGVGYKFTGLEWEPEPLNAIKSNAAKARQKATARGSVSQPPDSTPSSNKGSSLLPNRPSCNGPRRST